MSRNPKTYRSARRDAARDVRRLTSARLDMPKLPWRQCVDAANARAEIPQPQRPKSVGAAAVYDELRAANEARQAEWDKDDRIDILYRAVELAGEAGEACNVVKKLERERMGILGSRDTLAHLAEELADVVICADLVALAAGIELERAVREKFNATSEKVGLKTRMVERRWPTHDPMYDRDPFAGDLP